jgi:hypothetical protein
MNSLASLPLASANGTKIEENCFSQTQLSGKTLSTRRRRAQEREKSGTAGEL